jgi:hypothetical protein
MPPQREILVQLARLTGAEAFAERFGSPQTADPDAAAIRAFVEERLHTVADGLVSEAAASDDVTDRASATSYLEDRLTTLADLLTGEQASRIRSRFSERTAGW